MKSPFDKITPEALAKVACNLDKVLTAFAYSGRGHMLVELMDSIQNDANDPEKEKCVLEWMNRELHFSMQRASDLLIEAGLTIKEAFALIDVAYNFMEEEEKREEAT